MLSKGKVVAGFGLGALLVGACGEASRSTTSSRNGSTKQGDNASADAQVIACTDVGAQSQLGGLLTTDSPTMNGSFLPHGAAPPAPTPTTDVAPTCAAPLAMPPVTAGNDFHYATYTFANEGDAATCVSVMFILGFITEGPPLEELAGVETLAYLGSFDPSDIQKNYLAGYFGLQFGNGVPAPNDKGDFGSPSGGVQAVFSFTVPAHTKFVVVVSGKEKPAQDVPAGLSALYMPYALDVTNCTGRSDAGAPATDAGSGEQDAGSGENDAGTRASDAGENSGGNTW